MVNDNMSLVREQLRFAAWNIRIMSGREVELVEEMKKYRLEMLGVSEANMRGNGEKGIGDVRCVFGGSGWQSKGRCGDTLVREIGQVPKGARVCQ